MRGLIFKSFHWLAWPAATWAGLWLALGRLGLAERQRLGLSLAGALFLAIAIPLVFHHIKQQRFHRSGVGLIDQMDGQTFERYLAGIFRRAGYGVKTTAQSGDYGADLLISRDGQTTVVQAKRHQGAVGVAAVQQAAAARQHYGAELAMVVASSRFSRQARLLAQSNDIELWDRRILCDVATGRKTIRRR